MSYLKLKDTYMCEYNRTNRIGTDCNTLSSLDCLHDEDDPDFRPDLQTDENCTYKNNAWNCPSLNPGSPTILSPCVCGGQGVCSLNDQGQPVCKCNPGYSGSKCNSCSDGYNNTNKPGYNPICVTKCFTDRGTWDGSKCNCFTGYAGTNCECSEKPPMPERDNYFKDCNMVTICPYGAGTSLTPGSCKHGSIFPHTSPEYSKKGCIFMRPEGFFGPDCNVQVNSKRGIENVRFQQDFCAMGAKAIDTNASNAKIRKAEGGIFYGDHAGMVNVGPKIIDRC